jgi:hypothetical protein
VGRETVLWHTKVRSWESSLADRYKSPVGKIPQPQLLLAKRILVVRFSLTVSAKVRCPVRIDRLSDAESAHHLPTETQVEHCHEQSLVTAPMDAKYLNPGDYVLRITPQRLLHSEYLFQASRPRAGFE